MQPHEKNRIWCPVCAETIQEKLGGAKTDKAFFYSQPTSAIMPPEEPAAQ